MYSQFRRKPLIFCNQNVKGKGGETGMNRKTIISLALALGLLLMGSVAYGSWNDRGPRGVNRANGYACPYANVDRTSYNAKAGPAARVAMPGRGYWHDRVKWNDDKRYGHGNRQGHRCFRIFGTCW
jgi:hypothetical protein